MKLANKRILLSQHRLVDFTGSEIITLEMAEYFSSMGAEVIVAVNNLDYPIKKYFDKLKDVKVYDDFYDPDLDRLIRDNPPDIAWIHHQIVLPSLLSDAALGKTKYIFSHLSSVYFQEFPLAEYLEIKLADAVIFNAELTKWTFDEDDILSKIPESKKIVLNNPAPEFYFTNNDIRRNRDALKSVLVVSNHIEPDLNGAMEILKDAGIEVDVAGVSNNGTKAYDRLSVDRLHSHDVVVSIGKTVQYALVGGIPVYCYDHFGGPGYLNNNNFNRALDYNFSGKGFSKKTSEEIANEIVKGYQSATYSARELKYVHSEEFSLNNAIKRVLSVIDISNEKKTLSKADKALYLHHFTLLSKHFKMEKEIGELNKTMSGIVKENERLKADVDLIRRGKVYTIALRMKAFKDRVLKVLS